MVHSPEFFWKTLIHFLLGVGLLCMALVQQLGDNWQVVCAASCLKVFVIMHVFPLFYVSVHSFY